MTLEINVDMGGEEVDLVLDNKLTLMAYKEGDHITYSKNFSKILDEDIYLRIKQICEILLKN